MAAGRRTGAIPRIMRHRIRVTRNATDSFRREMAQYFDPGGYLSWSARGKKYVILGTNYPDNGLGSCPDCGIGCLVIIRSGRTGKRFIGCSNYRSGCRASSPLLQKAMLKVLKDMCGACRWPMLVYRYSRREKWRKKCSNIECGTH